MENSLAQITKTACAPILDVSFFSEKYSQSWAKACVQFNKEAVDYITGKESIKYVVLGSSFDMFFKNNGQKWVRNDQIIEPSLDAAVQKFAGTISILRAAGKIPILVSPPPRAGFNVGDCLERYEKQLLVLGRSECDLQRSEYEKYDAEIVEGLKLVEEKTGISIVWLGSLMCNESRCFTKMDDVYLYRDIGHLTVHGSKKIIPLIDFDFSI